MCLIFCEQVDDSSASLSLAQLTQVYVYILVLEKKKKGICFVFLNRML